MHPAAKQDISIERRKEQDWPAVRAIYVESINSGNATFATSLPEWDRWNAGHRLICRLVARSGSDLLGWAALRPVSSRCVYSGVAEVSVYVAYRARRQGIGLKLLQALVRASEQEGIWTLQAGTFPENTASIELHKRCGLRILGTRERLGCRDGRWRDVILMGRRSAVVGL